MKLFGFALEVLQIAEWLGHFMGNYLLIEHGKITQGLLYRWTEHSDDLFWKKNPLGEGSKAPKLHPGGGFFGP